MIHPSSSSRYISTETITANTLNNTELSEVAERFEIDWTAAAPLINIKKNEWSKYGYNSYPLKQSTTRKNNNSKSWISTVHNGYVATIKFGSFKRDSDSVTVRITEKRPTQIRNETRIARKQEQNTKKSEKKQKNEEAKKENFQKAVDKFNSLDPMPSQHPYLEKKSLSGILARETKESVEKDKEPERCILVDFRNPLGKVTAIQQIFESKKKWVWGSNRSETSWHLIGDLNQASQAYICEGFADGASIHLATKLPVFVMGDVNSLQNGAKTVLDHFPDIDFINASDDDYTKQKDGKANAGRLAALKLSHDLKLKARIPFFGGNRYKDFSELFINNGVEAIQHTLNFSGRPKGAILRSFDNSKDRLLQILCVSSKQSSKSNSGPLSNFIASCLEKGYISLAEAVSDIQQISPSRGYCQEEIEKEWLFQEKKALKRVKNCYDIKSKNYHNVTFMDFEMDPIFHEIRAKSGTEKVFKQYSFKKHFSEKIASLPSNSVLILKSPCGSGKTETILKPIMHQNGRSMMIVARQSLAEETAERLGLTCYLDAMEGELSLSEASVVCINSLNKRATGFGQGMLETDNLCIDEATQVIAQINSSVVNKYERTPIYDSFVEAIQTCKGKVLMADADADDRLVKFVSEKFPDKKVYVLQSKNTPRNDITIKYGDISAAHLELEKVVETGQKAIIATDSSKTAEATAKLIKSKSPASKILVVTKNSKADDPRVRIWAKNPNTESLKYDYLIYNSTADCGVSITVDHFERGFGFYQGIVNPATFLQMLHRDRTRKEYTVGVRPIPNACFEHLQKKEEQDSALVNMSSLIQQKANDINWKNAKDLETYLTEVDQLKLSLSLKDKLTRISLPQSFRLLAQSRGINFDLIQTSRAEAKSKMKELKELISELNKEEISKTFEAKEISNETFLEYCKTSLLKEDQRFEKDKYIIKNHLCLNIKCEQSIEYFRKHRLKPVENLEILKADWLKADEFDRLEAFRLKDLTHRTFASEKKKIFEMLFRHLGTRQIENLITEGFRWKDAEAFLKELTSQESFINNYNYLQLGPKVSPQNCRDPIKFVKSILEKSFGLITTKKLETEKRTSAHYVCNKYYDILKESFETRKEKGLNVLENSSLQKYFESRNYNKQKEIPQLNVTSHDQDGLNTYYSSQHAVYINSSVDQEEAAFYGFDDP